VAAWPLASGLFSSPEKQPLILSLVLIVLTLGVYSQTSHFNFVNFDDDRYVTDNLHVRGGLTWNTVKWAVTSTDEANWHPLTWMSHALDVSLFRLNPAGHHYTSVLLHAVNVVLVFLLLWWSTRRAGPSFLVAAIFALHPINAESVAWVSERKNVLCTTFFLLTLAAYGAYASKPDWKRYLAVVGLFACALASKPMAVTLPFVLLLLDFWPLQRIAGWTSPSMVRPIQQEAIPKLLIEKIPLFALSAASALITMHAQSAAGAVGVLPFPPSVRLPNAIYSYVLYVEKAFWPAGLAPLYPHPGHSLVLWRVVASALFLFVVSALTLKMRRARPYLIVGWLWFLGTLVPVIGVVQVGNQAMGDRYAYIPLLGIFVMVVWAATDLAASRKVGIGWTLAPAAIVLLVLGAAAYRQIGFWRGGLELWTHALAVTSNNFVAETSVGGALAALGRTDEAYPHFVRAAEIQPNDPVARVNIGAYLQQHGRLAEAVPQYETVISLTGDSRVRATTYANLGSAYRDLGDSTKARASFDEAIRLNPGQFNAWLGRGLLSQQQGRSDDAIRDFAESVRLRPTPFGFLVLGKALAAANRPRDAVTAFQQALSLDPGMAEAQQALLALGH